MADFTWTIPGADELGGYQYVVAIEGYPYLLTDGDPAAALAAWEGTDWDGQQLGLTGLCLPGLVVDLDMKQEINPWDPFVGAGRARISVHGSDDTIDGDEFGRATHRSDAGAKTYLQTTVDPLSAYFGVESAGAFPATGLLHIGTECIAYGYKTADQFGILLRGCFAPFGALGTGTHFNRHHRVANADYGVPLNPVVSELPRIWKGRMVGIWLHERTSGGLSSKADARCVWAGKIIDIADDPETGYTVVDLEHMLDVVSRSTLLRDQFAGRVLEGVELAEGDRFTLEETIIGATNRTADPLIVVAGASTPYELEPGRYSADEVAGAMSAWLDENLADGNIDGIYAWSIRNVTEGWRVKCSWQLDTTVTISQCWWQIGVPRIVSRLLGLGRGGQMGGGGMYYPVKAVGLRGFIYDDTNDSYPAYGGELEPLAVLVESVGYPDTRIELSETKGTFSEQTTRLPAAFQTFAAAAPLLDWGIFLLDSRTVIAAYDAVTNELSNIHQPVTGLGSWGIGEVFDVFRGYGSVAPVEIKQILMLSGKFSEIISDIFYSTGALDYNDSTHDKLGYGIGLGLPWGLLGDAFDLSIDTLPGADLEVTIVIDKAKKFEDLISKDLQVRRTHLIFRNGTFQFCCWSTPSLERAVYALTENNKFEPVSQNRPRSASVLSSDWARPIVKIEYNRVLGESGEGDTYRDVLVIEDRTAVDDGGGQGETATISLPNVVNGEWAQSDVGVRAIAAELISWHGFFSRPIRKLRRSIGILHFFDLCVGDIVTVTDNDARDPVTGDRGTTNRLALVVAHRWTLGGAAAGSPRDISPMGGEVTLALLELDGIVRPYSPAAEILETENSGSYVSGYDHGNRTLRCRTSEHTVGSIVGLTPDLTYFDVGDKVRVVEVDPDDPAIVLTWLRTIEALTLTTVKFTLALSSPAWDGTKLYRMIPDLYGNVVSSQRANAFQADDVTGVVDDLGAPFAYGAQAPANRPDAELHSVQPEDYSVYGYGDGAPRDAGFERAMLRNSQTLIDHGTAIQDPWFPGGGITATPGGELEIMYAYTVRLQGTQWGADTKRTIRIRPLIYSTDGSLASLYVALASAPVGAGTIDGGTPITIGGDFVQVSFLTNSTTPSSPVGYLDLQVINDDGLAFVVIRGSQKMHLSQMLEFTMLEREPR